MENTKKKEKTKRNKKANKGGIIFPENKTEKATKNKEKLEKSHPYHKTLTNP